KLDLWRPDSTGDMDPVVVGCAFQRLAWVYRPVRLLLLLAVVVGNFLGLLPLNLLPLAILIRFLLVGRGLRHTHEVMSRVFDGAEHALVVLENSQLFDFYLPG